MEWYWAVTLLFGGIMFLMLIGIPVGLAFLVVNVAAATYWFGGSGDLVDRVARGTGLLVKNGFQVIATSNLVPVSMFLLMGELFFQTGLAARMFTGIDRLMGRVPGRLSYVTVAGGTAFAALSGSSMGSGALLGTLMVPEMAKRGYSKYMSMGPILGTGGIAILIPPSTLAVLLGTLAELDIGRLLIAGVMPGLVLALLYVVLIASWLKLAPGAAPAYDVQPAGWLERLVILTRDILPMLSIIVFVIWITVEGVASPIESSAFGALGVLFLVVLYPLLASVAGRATLAAIVAVSAVASLAGLLSTPAAVVLGGALLLVAGLPFRAYPWAKLWAACIGATRITIMALVIIFGSATFSQLLGFSGASAGLIRWATGFELSPMTMLLIMFGILILLGMFMDQLSMMLLTVPIFFPLAKQYGWDLIWFAIIMMMSFEISYTTPPFGLLLFVMQGVAPKGTTFVDIVLASLPYMACAFLLVGMIVVLPGIATWLPCQFEAKDPTCRTVSGAGMFWTVGILIGALAALIVHGLAKTALKRRAA
jgi:TRAP-type C4-dicarboxylate transport system permease large subunit